MAPPSHLMIDEPEPALDLDLDLRDDPDPSDGARPVPLGGAFRPRRTRRSSRHTHVRLVAALARLHDEQVDATTARPDPIVTRR